jgi:hypothetical protein
MSVEWSLSQPKRRTFRLNDLGLRAGRNMAGRRPWRVRVRARAATGPFGRRKEMIAGSHRIRGGTVADPVVPGSGPVVRGVLVAHDVLLDLAR